MRDFSIKRKTRSFAGVLVAVAVLLTGGLAIVNNLPAEAAGEGRTNITVYSQYGEIGGSEIKTVRGSLSLEVRGADLQFHSYGCDATRTDNIIPKLEIVVDGATAIALENAEMASNDGGTILTNYTMKPVELNTANFPDGKRLVSARIVDDCGFSQGYGFNGSNDDDYIIFDNTAPQVTAVETLYHRDAVDDIYARVTFNEPTKITTANWVAEGDISNGYSTTWRKTAPIYNANDRHSKIEYEDVVGNQSSTNIGDRLDFTLPSVVSVSQVWEEKEGGRVRATVTFSKPINGAKLGQGWYQSDTSGKVWNKVFYRTADITIDRLSIEDLIGRHAAEPYIFSIDKDAPVVVNISWNPPYWTNQKPTVTIELDSEVQKPDSSWTLSADKKTLTKTFSGNVSETVVIKDLVGNPTSQYLEFSYYDIQKPVVDITTGGWVEGNTYYANRNTVFTINASDSAGLKEVATSRTDTTPNCNKKALLPDGTYNCQFTTEGWADGSYAFKVTAYDIAGNYLVKEIKIVIDNEPPTITAKDGFVGSESDAIFSQVSFKLYDEYQIDKYSINGHEVKLSNNKWSDANFQNIKAYLVEGENVFVLYDRVGNSTEYRFTYDTTAPTVAEARFIDAGKTVYKKDNSGVMFFFNINEPLAGSPTLKLGGKSVAVVSGANYGYQYAAYLFIGTDILEGPLSIELEFTDIAGNQGSATATTDGSAVIVDRTAPDIEILEADETHIAGTIRGDYDSFVVTLTNNDTATSKGFSATDADFTANPDGTWRWSIDLTNSGLTAGDYGVTATTSDAAGNTDNTVTDHGTANQKAFQVAVSQAPESSSPTASGGQGGGGASAVAAQPVMLPMRVLARSTLPTTTDTTTETPYQDQTSKPSSDKPTSAGEVLGAEDSKTWSVLNLILAVATVFISAFVLFGFFGKNDNENKHGALRALTIVPAVGAIIAFFSVEDWTLPATFVDIWTILLLVILAAQIAVTVFATRNSTQK